MSALITDPQFIIFHIETHECATEVKATVKCGVEFGLLVDLAGIFCIFRISFRIRAFYFPHQQLYNWEKFFERAIRRIKNEQRPTAIEEEKMREIELSMSVLHL